MRRSEAALPARGRSRRPTPTSSGSKRMHRKNSGPSPTGSAASWTGWAERRRRLPDAGASRPFSSAAAMNISSGRCLSAGRRGPYEGRRPVDFSQARISRKSVNSGREPIRTGGPVVPSPRLTYIRLCPLRKGPSRHFVTRRNDGSGTPKILTLTCPPW